MKKLLSIALLVMTTGIAAQELQLVTAEQPAPDSVSSPVVESNQSMLTDACPFLDVEDGMYYLDNNITAKEYQDFLKNNSPEA